MDLSRFKTGVMRFDRVYTPEEITEPILEVMRRNALTKHVHIRPVVYLDGYGPVGSLGPIEYAVTAVPSGIKDTVGSGVAVQVSSWQ